MGEGLCTRCGGAGWTFHVSRTPRHRACVKCNTTGLHPAPHSAVIAVNEQRKAA